MAVWINPFTITPEPTIRMATASPTGLSLARRSRPGHPGLYTATGNPYHPAGFITGDFFWDSPPQQGEYNIAILVEEWRNGVKIGSVLRDMQIIITPATINLL